MQAMRLLGLLTVTLLLAGGLAQAQPPSVEDELTITLIPDPDADLPEAVTRTIALPEPVSEENAANAEQGLETANAARDRRQEGLDTAREASERGQEFGAEMTESARENRESFGRGQGGNLPDQVPDLPDVPDDIPGPDDLPDQPTPPDTPTGPPGN